MISTGYANFCDIDCIYFIDKRRIRLIPTKEEAFPELNRHFDKHDFFFTFEKTNEKNVAYIDRVQTELGESLDLYPKYILHTFGTGPISTMEITGPAIDEVFHPASYYYIKAKTENENEIDLTHEIEEADKWQISINSIPVTVTLQYGGILRRGLASDMMLHPQIVATFSPTEDSQFLYEVYLTITRFLELTQYNRNFGECAVRVHGNEPFNSGYLYDWKMVGVRRSFFSESEYRYIKPYIGQMLQFSANNTKISLDFLPDATYRWNRTDYSPQIYAALFAAFESEYKANEKAYEPKEHENLDVIKSFLIQKIHECKSKDLTSNERNFVSQAEDKIRQIGNQTGQARKIKNVISALGPALRSSADHLFIRGKLGNKDGFSSSEINTIAQKMVDLRSQIAHEYTLTAFDDFQAEYVRFLEVLVHAQMLKRAGIDDTGIELLIDLVFHCNFTHMGHLVSKNEVADD